jgi:tetratricopeptide (TPR) repeat protein
MAANPTALPPRYLTVEERVREINDTAATDMRQAMALAARAKADGIADPSIHHLLALELRGAGRFEEAIVELGLGLDLDPHDPKLLTTMGYCLLELDRRQAAAKMFEIALKYDPHSPEANHGYGWAAERLGALDAAQSGFARAVAYNPKHADALAGLSELAVRKRDWKIARDFANRALAVDPRQTVALMSLAKIDIGTEDYDGAERRMADLLAMPGQHPMVGVNANLLLGDALDGAGRYRKAFAAYARGKAHFREAYRSMFEAEGASNAPESVRGNMAEFLETPTQSWSAPRSSRKPERVHAFLTGFPRSGTTLLEQVLDTHPSVVALGERPLNMDAEIEFLTQRGGITRLASVVSDLLEPFRESYWKNVSEYKPLSAGDVFVDKHPFTTVRLPLIAKEFPTAKIIFMIRDPRDVVLSCFRRSFNVNPSTYEFSTLEGGARYYAAVMEAGAAYLDRLPLDILKIRYEDLVADFEGQTKAMCDFLGIEWTARLRDFAETARANAIATPSSTQVGRGLYESGVDQWRSYDFALKPVLPILQPWIEHFGYAAD